MLTIGRHTLRIREHRLAKLAGHGAVKISGTVESGDDAEVVVWLTDKAMGIARASLALCGFDIDEHELERLHEEPFFLADREVAILTEEGKRGLQSSIILDTAPSKSEMSSLTLQLRAVKKNGWGKAGGTRAAPDEVPHPADTPDDLPF